MYVSAKIAFEYFEDIMSSEDCANKVERYIFSVLVGAVCTAVATDYDKF